MMQSEFESRIQMFVSHDEYYEIEQAYYGFCGNKDEFCAIVKHLINEPILLDDFLRTCYDSNPDKDYFDNHYQAIGYLPNNLKIEDMCVYSFEFSAWIAVNSLVKQFPDGFDFNVIK